MISLVEHKKFKVSKFPQNFKISKFQISKVPKFQRLENPFHVVVKILILYYQKIIPCFLQDIDPLIMLIQDFQNIDGSSGMFGPRLFQHVQHSGFPKL